MKLTMIAAMFCLGPAMGFAGDWTGALVDSKCYDALERNANPTSTEMDVNRDRDAEIRYCRPKPKAKFFAIVNMDGMSFKLDPAGNPKVAALLSTSGKQARYEVDVAGEMNGKDDRRRFNHVYRRESQAIVSR